MLNISQHNLIKRECEAVNRFIIVQLEMRADVSALVVYLCYHNHKMLHPPSANIQFSLGIDLALTHSFHWAISCWLF